MKRNFYALFALLTALSGPLAITPPAVSKASTKSISVDGESADDHVATRARFEQEHNQPTCQFPAERLEAPEDLIVLPEDFDYELFAEQESCELPKIDAGAAQENSFDHSEVPYFEGEAALDHLCLPFVERDDLIQSWEGPPVAGINTGLESPTEAAVTDPSTIAGGQWVARLALNGLRSSAARLSQVLIAGADRSVSTVRGVNEYETTLRGNLFLAVSNAALSAWEGFLCEFSAYTIPLYEQKMPTVVRHSAERPFCFCWARDEDASQAASEAESAPIQRYNQLEFAQPEAYRSQTSETEQLPEVPNYEVQLFNTPVLQNDAVLHPHEADQYSNTDETVVDLEELKGTVFQVLGIVLEKAEMLDRWSKEYEFEPFPNADLETEESEE